MGKSYKIHYTKTENAPLTSTMNDGEFSVGMNPSKPRIWSKLSDSNLAEFIPLSEINKKLSELPFARYYTGSLIPDDYFGEDGSIYLQTND